ncbi:hypothetical protein Vadar_001289 [Vaccinium darrowii]|uniref:Uncharacterized protein n=1 Tax=Vaccinium darrowii TaxID=229202 RepID=A0ACB7X7G2_9ERIC|nr:hypothetical protein Vadar_001289 [Vaccinium darrowii]
MFPLPLPTVAVLPDDLHNHLGVGKDQSTSSHLNISVHKVVGDAEYIEPTSTAFYSIRSSSYVTTTTKNATNRGGASSCTTSAVSDLISDRSQQPCLSFIWLRIWSSSCLDCHEQLPASKSATDQCRRWKSSGDGGERDDEMREREMGEKFGSGGRSRVLQI